MKSTKAPNRARPPKGSSGSPITLKGDGDIVAVIAKQKEWGYQLAAKLEAGTLPTEEYERKWIATVLKNWADQLRVPEPPKRRGNPKFARKVPDDDTIALAVGYQIAFGDKESAAIAHVAELWGVDESTVAKMFRKRREAVAGWFEPSSNLRHRVGAIRGK